MKIPRTPRGAGEPRVGLTPEREGWAPGRVGIPGMEMLLESGKAGEPGQGRPHFHIPGGIPVYGSREAWEGREAQEGRDPREGRETREGRDPPPESFTVRGCRADVPGLASVTRKGR